MASTSPKGDLAKVSPPEQQEPFPHFKESLAYQAQLFARLTQNDYMARIAGTGIAPAQAYVLGELWFNEPLSQVELARRLEIGKATIGQTLTRLERAGVIERRRVQSDRRVVMVHLTEKGRSLREPLRGATVQQTDALEEALGKRRMEELTETLTRVNQILLTDFNRPGLD
ncbi:MULTISPECIES: MarR family winged helix-turn-helix transcriptional regulator [Sphingobium]|uniref:MarR family winged helix-turn-helix transcriptional regulator n=1 Tax=Sphingobium sp. MI1205 TaxID=407020 RepID=UPI0007700995|nr:MarR family transcriptional regulator [Sphingobium sp. MI1205]AMK19851.1 transcriptional regulator [Sphingobium sp. MI1205]